MAEGEGKEMNDKQRNGLLLISVDRIGHAAIADVIRVHVIDAVVARRSRESFLHRKVV